MERKPSVATQQAMEMQTEMQQLAEQMRDAVSAIDDARAQALFETSAEVLLGLKKAFVHYAEKEEEAWQKGTASAQRVSGETLPPRESAPGESAGESDRHAIEDKYNFHEASFRRHYQLNYDESGHEFDYYAPAYRFGYELAEENPHAEWQAVSGNAQRHWEAAHTTGWAEMAEAVRYGWKEERDPESLRVHHS